MRFHLSFFQLSAFVFFNAMAAGAWANHGGRQQLSFFLCKPESKVRYAGEITVSSPTNQVLLYPQTVPFDFALPLPAGVTIKAIESGIEHMLFLLTNGKVLAMGNNFYGQLGDGTKTHRSNAVEVSNLNNAVSVGAGGASSFFVLQDGTVKVVGSNGFLQLGISNTNLTNIQQLMNMQNITNAVKVDAGYTHSVILDKDGYVWACGQSSKGQIGDSAINVAPQPQKLNSINNVKDISTCAYHTLFLKQDGTVWAAGENIYGQLGDSTNTNRRHVVKVPIDNVKAIAAGEAHSLFLKQDGTVWACGINNFGQLGTGDFTDYNYPVQIPGLSNIVAIGAGFNQSMFLRNDGKVWVCGANPNAQLGLGDSTDRDAPELITGLCTVSTEVQEIMSGNSDIRVLSNPVYEVLRWSAPWGGRYHVQLTDVQGKIIFSENININAEETQLKDVRHLPQGIYYFSAAGNEGKTNVKKILKL